jgi:choline kinase
VSGKNTLKIKEELSWVPIKKLTIVDMPILSDMGCAASMRAGLKAVMPEIDRVNIVMGDLVLTEEAVRRVLETTGDIRITITNESNKTDGKVFFNPRHSSYYVSKTKQDRSHIFKGKFVGFVSLSRTLAKALEKKIPMRTQAFCSDYIQMLFDRSTHLVELDNTLVGEIDNPGDYRQVLLNNSINKLMSPSAKIHYTINAENFIQQRFIEVCTPKDAFFAQQYGFDGVWMKYGEKGISSMSELKQQQEKLTNKNFLLPIVCEFKQKELEFPWFMDRIKELLRPPITGVCIQLNCASSELIEEIVASLSVVQKNSEKCTNANRFTILFRINPQRSISGKEFLNLINEKNFDSIAFVENIRSENVQSQFNNEENIKLPVAAFVMSHEIPLQKLSSLNYFAIIYPDLRVYSLSDNSYQRLLIQLSSYGRLVTKNISEAVDTHNDNSDSI